MIWQLLPSPNIPHATFSTYSECLDTMPFRPGSLYQKPTIGPWYVLLLLSKTFFQQYFKILKSSDLNLNGISLERKPLIDHHSSLEMNLLDFIIS